jgi:hypothetical protein
MDLDQVKEAIEVEPCGDCQSHIVQCFICKKNGRYFGNDYSKSRRDRPNVIKLKKEVDDEYEVEDVGRERNEVTKCSTANCNRFYHCACIDTLENAGLFKYIDSKSFHFRCSLHYCAKCGESGETMTILQCSRCPRALHLGCMDRERVQKLNKKYLVCEKHKPAKAKARLPSYLEPQKASTRRLLNEDYRELKYERKARERKDEEGRARVELTYEELGIPPPDEFDYAAFEKDWCRYCGARVHSNFTKGPWGPKTLCTVHYLDWSKKRTLNLSEHKERPLRPINPGCREELRYISDRKHKNSSFDPKKALEAPPRKGK